MIYLEIMNFFYFPAIQASTSIGPDNVAVTPSPQVVVVMMTAGEDEIVS